MNDSHKGLGSNSNSSSQLLAAASETAPSAAAAQRHKSLLRLSLLMGITMVRAMLSAKQPAPLAATGRLLLHPACLAAVNHFFTVSMHVAMRLSQTCNSMIC